MALLLLDVCWVVYHAKANGPNPKHNVVPAHSGPEEALMKLFWLFKNDHELKNKRQNFGAYSQDSIPFFQQKTIEGHAVRATLFATGATSIALENRDPKYIKSISSLWDNMVGKRMFISGGVGVIAADEKFGQDYYLPTDAYLETCAAVGAGFFSQRMNQLMEQGEYIDELERVLFNSVLTEVSLSGNLYTYQNPLNAKDRSRWNWHGCPCCLKLRIPGWARSVENPFGLYQSKVKSEVVIKINGKPVKAKPFNGYISINRTWKADDDVEMVLPIEPRFVYAKKEVNVLNGLVAIAAGPILYCLEGNFNDKLDDLRIDTSEAMKIVYNPGLLDGVNIIEGKGVDGKSQNVKFKAIPFYHNGNIKSGDNYKVWVPWKN